LSLSLEDENSNNSQNEENSGRSNSEVSEEEIQMDQLKYAEELDFEIVHTERSEVPYGEFNQFKYIISSQVSKWEIRKK
jgi:hypothetical protein